MIHVQGALGQDNVSASLREVQLRSWQYYNRD